MRNIWRMERPEKAKASRALEIGMSYFFVALVAVFCGYFWGMHHEAQIAQRWETEAAQKIAAIAEAFEDGREFAGQGHTHVGCPGEDIPF